VRESLSFSRWIDKFRSVMSLLISRTASSAVPLRSSTQRLATGAPRARPRRTGVETVCRDRGVAAEDATLPQTADPGVRVESGLTDGARPTKVVSWTGSYSETGVLRDAGLATPISWGQHPFGG
jgi:hypothetical protein